MNGELLAKLLIQCENGDIVNVMNFIKENPDLLNVADEDGWNCLINASKKGFRSCTPHTYVHKYIQNMCS